MVFEDLIDEVPELLHVLHQFPYLLSGVVVEQEIGLFLDHGLYLSLLPVGAEELVLNVFKTHVHVCGMKRFISIP